MMVEEKKKRRRLTPEEKAERLAKEMELDMKKIDREFMKKSRAMELRRARSISIGTAFGGVTELMIRDHNNDFTFALLQPVEVIEMLYSLAANVGCTVEVKPRVDFASWRAWHIPEQEKLHYSPYAPAPNDMAPFNKLGALGEDTPNSNSAYNKTGMIDYEKNRESLEFLSKIKEPDFDLIQDKTNPSVLNFSTQKIKEEVLNEDSMAIKKVID